jgi:hypothetical protein
MNVYVVSLTPSAVLLPAERTHGTLRSGVGQDINLCPHRVGRAPWVGDQAVARFQPTQDGETHTNSRRGQLFSRGRRIHLLPSDSRPESLAVKCLFLMSFSFNERFQ